MGKSRAEIQKGYRGRKKQKEGESYLAKERQRRMTYYTPCSKLSHSSLFLQKNVKVWITS